MAIATASILAYLLGVVCGFGPAVYAVVLLLKRHYVDQDKGTLYHFPVSID